jgi:hypothetical protein
MNQDNTYGKPSRMPTDRPRELTFAGSGSQEIRDGKSGQYCFLMRDQFRVKARVEKRQYDLSHRERKANG